VKENRDHLKDENLGTTRSAAIFIKLLNVARESKMEDIYKVLKSSKNKDILYVLLSMCEYKKKIFVCNNHLNVKEYAREGSCHNNSKSLHFIFLKLRPAQGLQYFKKPRTLYCQQIISFLLLLVLKNLAWK
jgi:hypothetical protein